ncbi:MAG: flagellar motor protein MotD [Pseudomonadota bacterium]|jgi:chemotaxis protein MotB|nr:MAG: flagellar motor protein MotD [Pseudomonadota bacterium]
MARRRRHHEEGENHERWAIPYGDLVTLLLAFFVVMYSISQVNEGKYRILSDSLNAAFRGEPTTFEPVQVGHQAATTVAAPLVQLPPDLRTMAMRQIAAELAEAMHPLIIQGLVDVEYGNGKVTIAIRSDILFALGSATPSPEAQEVARLLGQVLRNFPVDIRVEGHTDNVPVVSGRYKSNWELSAARAASVVHLLISGGVAPERLYAVAYGEHRPVLPNDTVDGRNANRRVVLVVEAGEESEAVAAQQASDGAT